MYNSWRFTSHRIRVARAQNEVEKANDLIAWRNLGLPKDRREPLLSTHLSPVCCSATYREKPCNVWATYRHGGSLYCHHHKPEGSDKL